MKPRTVKQIIASDKVNMGGHLIDQPLPAGGVDYIDPFLMIHHWHDVSRGGYRPNEVDVPPHPHRGFSPVTFVYKGDIHHRDSLGNSEVVRAGGTQWLNAGKGITHSERPSKQLANEGGEVELIQFGAIARLPTKWMRRPTKQSTQATRQSLKSTLPRWRSSPENLHL